MPLAAAAKVSRPIWDPSRLILCRCGKREHDPPVDPAFRVRVWGTGGGTFLGK